MYVWQRSLEQGRLARNPGRTWEYWQEEFRNSMRFATYWGRRKRERMGKMDGHFVGSIPPQKVHIEYTVVSSISVWSKLWIASTFWQSSLKSNGWRKTVSVTHSSGCSVFSFITLIAYRVWYEQASSKVTWPQPRKQNLDAFFSAVNAKVHGVQTVLYNKRHQTPIQACNSE